MGRIHMPPDFDLYNVEDYYYRIYITGLGIRSADTPERVKDLLTKEKIEVTEVQLSRNGDFLAVFTKDLPNLLKIVWRTTTNGYIILPGRKGYFPPPLPSRSPLPPLPLPSLTSFPPSYTPYSLGNVYCLGG